MESPAAGGCVLLGLGGTALAAVFAASATAGVLTVWAVGGVVLWRSVRKINNPSPPPPATPTENTNPQFTVTEDRPGHCTIQWHKEVNDE